MNLVMVLVPLHVIHTLMNLVVKMDVFGKLVKVSVGVQVILIHVQNYLIKNSVVIIIVCGLKEKVPCVMMEVLLNHVQTLMVWKNPVESLMNVHGIRHYKNVQVKWRLIVKIIILIKLFVN